jgi:cephalosporin hydroxylase
VVRAFQRMYYLDGERTWLSTTWRGTNVTKSPMDLWVYQEIVHELRPAVVVETGTFMGGSALFLADVFDLLGHGRVVTVDLNPQPDRPEHPRITYVTGSSVAADVVARVREEVAGEAPVMVVLDSDHHAPHVAAELEAYHDLVTPGSYLIVEDTVVNGHPVEPLFGPGPLEALQPFLAAHPEFTVDRHRERLGMTFNPGGWLRRSPA